MRFHLFSLSSVPRDGDDDEDDDWLGGGALRRRWIAKRANRKPTSSVSCDNSDNAIRLPAVPVLSEVVMTMKGEGVFSTKHVGVAR